MRTRNLFWILIALVVVSCNSSRKETQEKIITLSGLNKENFQSEVKGKKTDLYVLTNANGMEVAITNYGGVIVSVMVPDRDGEMQDVVLGFDNIDDYVNIKNDFGATIGRYGNRIANGKIVLGDVEYELSVNDNGNTLHGGPEGFNTQVFDAKQLDEQTLELTYLSVDGEMGFPGNLDVKVVMKVTDDNAIEISYEAVTDKETVCNLTNHSYFNLNGDGETTVLDHTLMLNADGYTPVNETLIPTGVIESVKDTPMDFTVETAIGERIDDDFEQLVLGRGYDHNWVLNSAGDVAEVAATVYSPTTGIQLDTYTSEPGLQVYTGNFLDGSATGKNGAVYNFRSGVCLETQKYPDTPNNPDWPSANLSPGDLYTSKCVYKFSVR